MEQPAWQWRRMRSSSPSETERLGVWSGCAGQHAIHFWLLVDFTFWSLLRITLIFMALLAFLVFWGVDFFTNESALAGKTDASGSSWDGDLKLIGDVTLDGYVHFPRLEVKVSDTFQIIIGESSGTVGSQ